MSMSFSNPAVTATSSMAVEKGLPATCTASRLDETATALAEQLRQATSADPSQGITLLALQKLFAALCEFYAHDVAQRGAITPLNTLDGASPTAILMTTTALLRGANLELFELGMWQTWSGMK